MHFIKLDKGEDVIETITSYINKADVHAAVMSAIGVLKEVELGYYDLHEGKYIVKKIEEDMELMSFSGNIGILNGKAHPHIHVVLAGPDFNCVGGHLLKAKVGVTCELFMNTFNNKLERIYDDNIKLNLLTPVSAEVKK